MKKLILLLLIPIFSLAQNDTPEISKENSVDQVILKNELNKTSPNNNTFITTCAPTLKNIQEPLFIYNNKIISREELNNINFDEIRDVTILKNEKAVVLYGSRANAGVVLINGNDIETYDLLISDTDYHSFLNRQPSFKTSSLTYLKEKNRHYVTLWNHRVITGDPEIYDTMIDYDSDIFYGLEFEYKLYQYFKFIEHKYSINLS